jgi:TonB-linked SusC/RagA family outer membrane protein
MKFENIRTGTFLKLFTLCIILFLTYGAKAQNTITGKVTDVNGIPLNSVNVLEKGTTNGVVTNFDGEYSITLKENQTLIFSYLGFKTKEIVLVEGQTVLNVTLEESAEALDEIVLIGYGSQLKENLSGSVSSIETKDIRNIPQVSIDQLIQGRAAGVNVTQNSGQPGSAVSVRIRGVGSLSGSSEPLYIIDGVPVSGDSRNISTTGRPIGSTGIGETGGSSDVSPLSNINPDDIESINVLKDASATAIYGSRGANGVVIITTKSGKRGKGKFSYSGNIAIQQPTNLIDVMALPDYARLQNAIGEIYNLQQDVAFLRPELLGPGTNWQKEIFDTAIFTNHQMSFSGGSDDVNYFISGGYADQEGTVIGSSFERANIRVNIDARVNDWLKTGINLTATRTNEQLAFTNAENGIISLSLLNNPATAVYNPDGSFAGPVTDEEIAFGFRNPIAEALSVTNDLTRSALLGNVYAEFKLHKNITYRTEFGGNFNYNSNERFQRAFTYGAVDRGTNLLNIREENTDFWIVKNLITFNKKFDDVHSLTFLVGQEFQQSTWRGIIAQDGNFVSNDLPILGTGDANDFTDQYQGSNALESYFTRAIYTFSNKYDVTASLRADGSSKFAEGNRWGYFPSLSAAWRLSNEDFMSDFEAIQNIKLYGGYGVVGNQDIPNFAFGSRLNSIITGVGTGFEFANFANEDLTWESSTQTNVGLDFSLFNSRLNTTIEVYNKVSKDFLFQLAVTDFITGGTAPGAITAPWVNLGQMTNRGIDVTLNFTSAYESEFKYNSTLTVSHYRNNVDNLLGDLSVFGQVNLDGSNQIITRTQAGDPIGLFFGYKTDGLFRSMEDIQGAPIQFGRPFEDALFSSTWLGDVKFQDINGDGVIDTDDRTVIGNPHPDFTFGWQNSFSYKNFDLNIFIQGSYGNDIFNAVDRALTAGNRTFTNQLTSVLDYWSLDNPNGSQPRLARNDTPNINISDRYIEDGSYVRLQNLTFGYNLPSQFISKFGLDNFKVFVGAQNLVTLTAYSGYDPEVGVLNQNPLLMGVDNGRYPTARTFTLGVNLDF